MPTAYEKIVEVLVSHLGLEQQEIRPTATFNDLDVDSLTLIELSVILEDEYGISADGIDPGGTLADTAAYLEAQVSSLVRDSAPAGERNAS